MNTPDQAPKNGDFVAYLAELERRQAHASRPTIPAAQVGKGTGKASTPTVPSITTPSTATSGPVTISPEAALAVVRSLPLGLVVVGLVLLIVGLAINGGGFLALVGVVMLVQAVRSVLKAAKDQSSSPGQQIAALLTSHVQNKKNRK